MPGELEDKIKDIGAMLGFTDIPDSITDLIGSFAQSYQESEKTEEPTDSGGSASDTSEEAVECVNPEDSSGKMCPNCEQESNDGFGGNFQDAMRLMELVSKYQSAKVAAENDHNLQLLRALSPYLSKKRQKRIRNCEKMITILKFL